MLETALDLLKIFEDNGYEAYLVGGFVRDFILNKKSLDIDVCTNATPKEIKELFSNVRLPFEQYGSVNLKFKKIDFEITTYRMDLEYTNYRTPSKIIYTDKLIIDLKRRDFTINTLCMDSSGKIIDLLNVKKDIDNKVIKAVGNAKQKLSEDSLRILRAIRFATKLDFKLDDDLKEAIADNGYLLDKLSFFRKKQELNKIFSSEKSEIGFRLIREFGLDKYLGIKLDKKVTKTSDPIGIWAQINPDDRYQFTCNEKKFLNKIKALVEKGKIYDIDIYNEGNYVCYIAAQILNIKEVSIHERYDSLPIKKRSDIKINVKDIITILNPKNKSIIKEVMNDIERKIIDRILMNNEDDIKRYIIDNYTNSVL